MTLMLFLTAVRNVCAGKKRVAQERRGIAVGFGGHCKIQYKADGEDEFLIAVGHRQWQLGVERSKRLRTDWNGML